MPLIVRLHICPGHMAYEMMSGDGKLVIVAKLRR
jgi:hypothetical protein